MSGPSLGVPSASPPQTVVTGAVRRRLVPQPQRVAGDDRDRRHRITATGEDVQDDVGRVDAVLQRLGAGGLDR